MAKVKITQDHSECIACGTCATVCGNNWRPSDDGKYEPVKTELNAVGCNQEAAENCPVGIIHVKVEDGE